MDVDLRRGKTDARGRVHRLQHIGRQTADVVVDLLDGLRARSQTRIGIFEYL